VFAGWYLRVADKQNGSPHPEAAYAVYSPSGATWGFDAVLEPSATISAAVVGQIAPAAGPPAGECGPPPPPIATVSAEGVARVECAQECGAVLMGTREGRKQLISRQVLGHDLLAPRPATEMRLSRGALESLGSGKIRLVVEIDGQILSRRTIRTPTS
jgi:hypothetical protein